MPNNNYFAQLSPEQKAELFSIYVNAGYKTLSSISADFNKRADGGLDKLKQLPSREELRDAIKSKLTQEKDFDGFVGGEFGGAGASDRFEYDPQGVLTERWIRNTPIPIERSFSKAYSDARKSGLSTFEFNGKTYNTNYDPNAKLGPREYDTIMANLREVLDENKKPISDSTRIEPWIGQIPGEHKMAYGGSNGDGFLNRMLGKVKQAFGVVSLPENTNDSGYNWTEDDVKNLARAFENKESKAYIGVKGDILGGYGHKLTDDEIAKYWDKKKSKSIGTIDDSVIDTWLNDDMNKAFKSVERYYGKDIPSNIWAALSSLAFQGGDLLIRGKRDSSNKIRKDWSGGSPLFEEAVKKYLEDKSDTSMQGIIDQMQYKDDGNPKLSGLSSRYGLYRAMIDNTADPSKIYEYKNDGTYKLYKSNKKKN